jgi:hypothetical protein
LNSTCHEVCFLLETIQLAVLGKHKNESFTVRNRIYVILSLIILHIWQLNYWLAYYLSSAINTNRWTAVRLSHSFFLTGAQYNIVHVEEKQLKSRRCRVNKCCILLRQGLLRGKVLWRHQPSLAVRRCTEGN